MSMVPVDCFNAIGGFVYDRTTAHTGREQIVKSLSEPSLFNTKYVSLFLKLTQYGRSLHLLYVSNDQTFTVTFMKIPFTRPNTCR